MLRRVLDRCSDLTQRALLRTVRPDDPWRRFRFHVPLHVYGQGSQRDFSWYLDGESTVEVRSVEEVVEWLAGCGYARDPELFGAPDVWQHPAAFERLRRGDCEDHALWAWRKLRRLGLEAEFVAGHALLPGRCVEGHAWVVFRDAGTAWVLDGTARDAASMTMTLDAARGLYLPEASVDEGLRRWAYAGYLRRRRAGRSAGPADRTTLFGA